MIELLKPLSQMYNALPAISNGVKRKPREPARAIPGRTSSAIPTPKRVITKLVKKICTKNDTQLLIAATMAMCWLMAGPSR